MIGWSLFRSKEQFDKYIQDGYGDIDVKPREYPCWAFEHARYDESTTLEFCYEVDLMDMLGKLREKT